MQEPRAHVLFQACHGSTDRRGRHAQLARGLRETAIFNDPHEGGDVVEVQVRHRPHLTSGFA
jgi:hypothetical protein